MSITIKELAKLTGTSTASVSLVLSGNEKKRVGKAKSRMILKVAREHGYRKNTTAQALSCRCTMRIGLCIYSLLDRYSVISNAHLYETIAQVSNLLYENGYGIDIIQHSPRGSYPDLIQSLTGLNCDNLLFINWESSVLRKLFPAMHERGIPVFSLGAVADKTSCWGSIDLDDMIVKPLAYLRTHGISRIALLNTENQWLSINKSRVYKRTMEQCGLHPLPVYCTGDKTNTGVTDLLKKLLTEQPDVEAILLGDSLFAQPVINALGDRKIRLIGVGDSTYANICSPKLSHVQIPSSEITEWCVKTMLECIELPSPEPRQKLFDAELVIKQT